MCWMSKSGATTTLYLIAIIMFVYNYVCLQINYWIQTLHVLLTQQNGVTKIATAININCEYILWTLSDIFSELLTSSFYYFPLEYFWC